MKEALLFSPQCMLPSFIYTLPEGQETGTYLALEVGGSNLRMALVHLQGPGYAGDLAELYKTVTYPINPSVRMLQNHAFFDWMAVRIKDMLSRGPKNRTDRMSQPFRIGVAWAFPIDQTSLQSGNVLGMGKNFSCSDAVKGKDLGDMIWQACYREVMHQIFS